MKKILIILGVLALLALVALFAVRHFTIGYLTPDFVVRTIEARWNCRAEIGDVSISPGGTTTIEITDVALAPRDKFADEAVPLDDRPKLEGAMIRVASMKLEVRPGDLMKRHLGIEHLVIQKAEVDTEINLEGKATVDALFEKPGTVAPSEASDEDEAVTLAVVADGDATDGEVVGGEPADDDFVASDMKISTAAGLVELRDSRITILLAKSGAKVLVEDLQMVFEDIDVDPNQLVGHNTANFDFSGTVAIEGQDAKSGQPLRFADLKLSGGGALSPFNAETGIIEPAWTSEVVFLQGSEVKSFPLIEELQTKLADIDAGGVDFSDVRVHGVLGRDSGTRLAHRQGRFTLEQPLTLDLPDVSFIFDAASWADTASNEHQVNGVVIASEELTAKVAKGVDDYVSKKTGGLLGGLSRIILEPVMDNGRISLKLVSEGDMSEPKVDLVTGFGKLSDLKDVGGGLKDVGESLLKGLFGK